MVAAAIVGGASVVGAVSSASAAGKAADAQAAGANSAAAASKYAADIQKEIYEQQREDFAPWRTVGQSALGQLADMYGLASPYSLQSAPTNDNSTEISNLEAELKSVNNRLSTNTGPGRLRGGAKRFPGGMGAGGGSNVDSLLAKQADLTSRLNALRSATPEGPAPELTTQERQTAAMDKFFESPNYRFTLDEGLKTLDRYSAAKGSFASGNTLKAATGYAEGLASNEFGNYQNSLMSMAGLGQTAAGGQAAAGNAYSSAVGANAANQGNAALAAGNARASGYLNQAGALNQGLENVMGYYTLSSMMG